MRFRPRLLADEIYLVPTLLIVFKSLQSTVNRYCRGSIHTVRCQSLLKLLIS